MLVLYSHTSSYSVVESVIPGVSLPRRKMGVSGGVGKTPPFQKKKKRSPIMRRMQFVFARAFPIPGSAQMDNEGEKHTYDG